MFGKTAEENKEKIWRDQDAFLPWNVENVLDRANNKKNNFNNFRIHNENGKLGNFNTLRARWKQMKQGKDATNLFDKFEQIGGGINTKKSKE